MLVVVPEAPRYQHEKPGASGEVIRLDDLEISVGGIVVVFGHYEVRVAKM
ncbi:MAG: hypothetical protein ACJ8R9_21805 [Steroidobacteraceae bacterium]